jgi:hypothetical protein
VGGPRAAGDRRQQDGDRAARVGDAGEEVAGARHHVRRLGTGGYERLERDLDVERLARRAALVGLEPVAEPAVVVAVGDQGGHDGRGVAPVSSGGEEELVEQPPLGEDECVGGGCVDGHGPGPRRALRVSDATIRVCTRSPHVARHRSTVVSYPDRR